MIKEGGSAAVVTREAELPRESSNFPQNLEEEYGGGGILYCFILR